MLARCRLRVTRREIDMDDLCCVRVHDWDKILALRSEDETDDGTAHAREDERRDCHAQNIEQTRMPVVCVSNVEIDRRIRSTSHRHAAVREGRLST